MTPNIDCYRVGAVPRVKRFHSAQALILNASELHIPTAKPYLSAPLEPYLGALAPNPEPDPI